MPYSASSPFWTELASIRNPAVQHLVMALPVVLLNDVAPSTGRAYLQAFGRWRTWASGAGFTPFPARAVHVALYLTSLIQQGTTFAPVAQGCAALRWLHRKAGHPDPIAAPVITQLQVAARRICARPVSRRTPISPSLFRQLMSTLAQPEAPLGDLQCATMICLGFFALLRWDDLQRLVVSSLDFTPTHIRAPAKPQEQPTEARGRNSGRSPIHRLHAMPGSHNRELSPASRTFTRPTRTGQGNLRPLWARRARHHELQQSHGTPESSGGPHPN